jgi:hypothetical protein
MLQVITWKYARLRRFYARFAAKTPVSQIMGFYRAILTEKSTI